MKILYTITELDVGGAERSLFTLATGLARQGHDIRVACLTGHGAVGEWLEKEGMNVHYLNGRPRWPLGVVLPLRRLVREFRPEVLHSFLFYANIVGRLVCWWEKVPAIISAVRVEDKERPWRWRLDGWTHGMMHAETCVSESARQFTHEVSGIPLEKLVAIPNAVDTNRFQLPRGAFRKAQGIPDETPAIVTVGRLERQKGMSFLLEAYAEVRRQVPEALLLIVGSGPDETALKAQADRLGLSDTIRFLGWRPDVPQILVDADLFVLASLWEGMPNVVLEAMAAGCPVIATEVGGSPEIIRHGESGLLVPPQQTEGLAQAMTQTLTDSDLRKRLAEGGKRRVLSEFSIERMVQANLNLYTRLLASEKVEV